MHKLSSVCFGVSLILSVTIFGGLITPATVVAQEEKIELDAKYPIQSGPSDTVFEFEVELSYSDGEESLTFELSAEQPPGWTVRIQQSAYEAKEISAIRLDPDKLYPETIVVVAIAPFWLYPEPGDYTIKLESAAKEIRGSIDLTARITARYGFYAETKEGRLNMKARAGQEAYLPIVITNTGTAALDKITFSSSKPAGWSITFKPEKIEALAPGDEQEVEVAIKPPPNTIAGDYMATLRFDGDPKPSVEPPNLDIRVTVTTPVKWGWIGVGIIIAVIAGLVATFTRLGRR